LNLALEWYNQLRVLSKGLYTFDGAGHSVVQE